MTSDRSQAYGRVMKTLDDIGPAKLHDLERQRLRNAADVLLFAPPNDPAGFDALTEIEHLTRFLAESERWTEESARQLADDVAACGPAWIGELPVIERAA
jgi:hypothetical protein